MGGEIRGKTYRYRAVNYISSMGTTAQYLCGGIKAISNPARNRSHYKPVSPIPLRWSVMRQSIYCFNQHLSCSLWWRLWPWSSLIRSIVISITRRLPRHLLPLIRILTRWRWCHCIFLLQSFSCSCQSNINLFLRKIFRFQECDSFVKC